MRRRRGSRNSRNRNSSGSTRQSRQTTTKSNFQKEQPQKFTNKYRKRSLTDWNEERRQRRIAKLLAAGFTTEKIFKKTRGGDLKRGGSPHLFRSSSAALPPAIRPDRIARAQNCVERPVRTKTGSGKRKVAFVKWCEETTSTKRRR